MKTTKPLNGCVTLDRLRNAGLIIPTGDCGVALVCRTVQRMAQDNRRMPAFFHPCDISKAGEKLNYVDMRPPFPLMWVEIQMDDDGDHLGYFVESKAGPQPDTTTVDITAFHLPADGKWGGKPRCSAAVRIQLNKDGDGEARGFAPVWRGCDSEMKNDELSANLLHPCVRMLQALNGINVGWYTHVHPDENDFGICRAARRRAADLRYKVLVLRDKAAIRAGRREVETPGIMPLHFARGHWAHYGPAYNRELLFGKYAGRYWVPAHAKGKCENGEVVKDYKLEPRRVDSFAAATDPMNVDRPAMVTVSEAFERMSAEQEAKRQAAEDDADTAAMINARLLPPVPPDIFNKPASECVAPPTPEARR